MATFEWRDRAGRLVPLTGYEPIEAALMDVRRDLRRYDAELGSTDIAIVRKAMTDTDPLVTEHNRLVADLDRWKVHARAMNAVARETAQREIEAIVAESQPVRVLHECWSEWRRLTAAEERSPPAGSPNEMATTALQRQVFAAFGFDQTQMATMSARQAMNLITATPTTCRIARPASELPYSIHDRDAGVMEVRSLIEIESEYLAVVDRLTALLPTIAEGTAATLAEAFVELNATGDRLRDLQCSLEGWAVHCDAMDFKAAKERRDALKDGDV